MTDHPRFQPWLLLVAAGSVLPILLRPPVSVPLLVMLAALAALAGVAWVRAGRPGFTAVVRDRWALALSSCAVVGFATVVTTVGTAAWTAFLLLGSALVAALSASRSRTVRWTLQGAVIGVLVAVGVDDGATIGDLLAPMLLLVGVGALSDAFVRELRRARRSELATRTVADQRTDLLETVRELPDVSASSALRTVVDAVRSLGYDAAAVLLEHDGRLEVVVVAGDGPAAARSTATDAPVRRALREPDTVLDDRGPARRVIVPILADGDPVGVLIGAMVGADGRDGRPRGAATEIVEVLADHLGVVLATERQVRRQHDLLDRMERLERMRSSFVAAVSTELRDPLTVIRGVGETLAARSEDIDEDRRRSLLRLMCEQTEELRRTIDALLDFSRFHASRLDSDVATVAVAEALDPVATALGGRVRYGEDVGPETLVVADLELVRHALELAGVTAVGSGRADLRVTREGDELKVRLEGRLDGTPPSALVRALVAQLLVAGGGGLASDREVTAVLRLALGQVRP